MGKGLIDKAFIFLLRLITQTTKSLVTFKNWYNCSFFNNMAHYRFNPRNHLCSLVWTFLLLITVSKETRLINGITCAALFGVPTVIAGINWQEKAEREKRLKIIQTITEQQMLTVSQAANILYVPAREAQLLLTQLHRESRINVSNRHEDMTVVYIPANQ